jgi:predicted metal-dependent hydrolase
MRQTALPFEPVPEASPPVAFVRHPAAKRYVIRVRQDGSVRVTIPRWGSKRQATAFYQSQQVWVADQQVRAARERAGRRPPPAPQLVLVLRRRAERELPLRLRELADGLGVRVRKVSIRNQRSRWGSCSRAGHICLNWRLVDMPPWVRDYVLIHELMHLKRMDHSPAFWKLVAAASPDWQRARRWLRAYSGTVSED